ncbi:MAG: glycolate oxidase, partial [Chthoniobacter sp.]|nr:glycolate oxidase [Chthoniobacter sp.]
MQTLVSELTELLSRERVLFEREHLITYGFDGTATLHGEAACVVFPQTTEEVSLVVKCAAARNTPIVSRGS